MEPLNNPSPEQRPGWKFGLQAVAIALALVAVFYFGQQGAIFFYQLF